MASTIAMIPTALPMLERSKSSVAEACRISFRKRSTSAVSEDASMLALRRSELLSHEGRAIV